MFGYININRNELSKENQKIYQSFYCGLCRTLKISCGTKGQILLNYDMTFLILLLSGLYELENEVTDFSCAMHPTKKQTAWVNEASRYAADMNVLLAYQNLEHDWKDEKSVTKKAFAAFIKKDYESIVQKYPGQKAALERYQKQQRKFEEERESNLDKVSGLMGEIVAEIFAWRNDLWTEELRSMGFYMGKFMYIMDAFEDLEKDIKQDKYNPLRYMLQKEPEGFETFCKLMLASMIHESEKSFGRLPVIQYSEIIQNILGSGIWTKYKELRLKKQRKTKKKDGIDD
ncbi:MAG: DUF5685 family protein [Lachnospiraceae bacterium]